MSDDFLNVLGAVTYMVCVKMWCSVCDVCDTRHETVRKYNW